MEKQTSFSTPFAQKTLLCAVLAATISGCSSSNNSSGDGGGGNGNGEESFTLAEMSANGYTIEHIENCGVNPVSAENATVFQDDTIENIVGGGGITMHPVQDPMFPDDPSRVLPPWSNLALSWNNPLYDLANLEASEDGDCNGLLTKTGILVTKYADWHHQHSNEFVPPLLDENKTFADIDSVILEFKLNSENTEIYSSQELETIYADKLAEVHAVVQTSLAQSEEAETDPEFSPRDDIDLTDFDFSRLDQEKAVVAVSVQNAETGAENVQAERYIEIAPSEHADRWIRVTIPFASMDFFTGEVWEKTPTTVEQQASTVINRLHIVGEILGTGEEETQYGDVLRNYIGSPGNDALYNSLDIPETFKEMSLTIKKIEVVWK